LIIRSFSAFCLGFKERERGYSFMMLKIETAIHLAWQNEQDY